MNATMILDDVQDYLGPARVCAVDSGRVLVDTGGSRAWAVMALGYRYQPVTGDSLLVIGRDGDWYVLGVLAGQGDTAFVAPGDVSIRAPRGSVRIVARDQVAITADRVDVQGGRFEVVVDQIVQRSKRVAMSVKELFRIRTRSSRVDVEKTHRVHAGRINHRASDVVNIDGRKINLG